jgi:hypothetical protein
MGLWDSITDAADAFGDAVSDVAESAYDTVTSSAIGDTIAWAADGVDTATFGLAGRAMNVADDYVFDSVDYVTGGAVNIDFDDGQFSVGAGIDGIASMGASVGEAGITANGGLIAGTSFDIGMTDDGFTASGSAGINWGPLPYAGGHIDLDPDGGVSINGELQGTIPTPIGLLSGEVSGGFVNTDQGWGAFVDADGTLRLPSGTTIRGGLDVAYQESGDDSQLSVGLDGSVSMPGLGTAGGSLDYDRIESDGDVVETFQAQGEVDALGMSATARADYAHSNIDGVERSDWSGDVDFDGPDLSDATGALAGMASSELGGTDVGMDDVLGTTGLDDTFDSAGMSDFDTAIESADSIDASLDDLVQDLQ